MDATKRTPAVNPNQQRNMLILIGAIVAIAIVVAIVAIAVSGGNATPVTAEAYESIPQERLADGGFVLGDPEAPITIVEFADFACPHCQSYWPTIHQLIEDYVMTGQARLEYRMFISAADPTYGPYTAQLAECAATLQEGGFWEAHDILFELGRQGRFRDTTARTLAERMGLNYSELLSCAQNANQYQTDVRLGSSLSVQSTPTIMIRVEGSNRPQFINAGGRSWDRGPVPYEILQAVIASSQ